MPRNLGEWLSDCGRFVKLYESIGEKATAAIRRYVQEVKSGSFPVEGEHTYPISSQELEKFWDMLRKRKGGRYEADIDERNTQQCFGVAAMKSLTWVKDIGWTDIQLY